MKENKKAKKVVALLLCAVLLVVGSVSATVAYLTDSKSVTNTFTVGNVAITLDEAITDKYGVATSGRTSGETGNEYKLIPGHTYVKDPTIHVAAGSEVCYLFVKVENGISGIEGATTIADQMNVRGWSVVDGNVYKYATTIDARNSATDIDAIIFDTFTIDKDKTDLTSFGDKKIIITAYAVQADGFANADAAWGATFGPSVTP